MYVCCTALTELSEPALYTGTATTVWYKITMPSSPATAKLVLQLFPDDYQSVGTWGSLTPAASVSLFVDPGTSSGATVNMLDGLYPHDYSCPDSWAVQANQVCVQFAVQARASYAIQVAMDPWPGFGLTYGLVSA